MQLENAAVGDSKQPEPLVSDPGDGTPTDHLVTGDVEMSEAANTPEARMPRTYAKVIRRFCICKCIYIYALKFHDIYQQVRVEINRSPTPQRESHKLSSVVSHLFHTTVTCDLYCLFNLAPTSQEEQ